MAFNISIQHDLNKMKRDLTVLELQALPQTTLARNILEILRVTFISFI